MKKLQIFKLSSMIYFVGFHITRWKKTKTLKCVCEFFVHAVWRQVKTRCSARRVIDTWWLPFSNNYLNSLSRDRLVSNKPNAALFFGEKPRFSRFHRSDQKPFACFYDRHECGQFNRYYCWRELRLITDR